MSTPVGTATAVKAASPVETPTAVETARAASEPAANRAAGETTAMTEAAASGETPSPSVKTPATEATVKATAPETPAAKIVAIESAKTMKPRAGTDEHAANKPIRSVIAVGSASIGVIPVVAVSAGGCVPVWANPNANYDLRLGRSCCWKNQNCQ
jgi:hypothetical protein